MTLRLVSQVTAKVWDSPGRGVASAVIMAVVVSVRGRAAVEDVERDVAGRGPEHHQVALAQGGLAVTTVTESTLLQTAGAEIRSGFQQSRTRVAMLTG